MEKKYIPVLVLHHPKGELEPQILYFNGIPYKIDEVRGTRQQYGAKRYTVIISGQQRYLYYTPEGWFVITKQPDDYNSIYDD